MTNVRRPGLRPALLLALTFAATLSQALTLALTSSGKGVDCFDFGGGESILGADLTTFSSQATSPAATSFDDANFGATVLGGISEGLLSCRSLDGDHALSLSLSIDSDAELLGIRALSGGWRLMSGKGDYAGFSPDRSGGTWSFEWDRSNDATTLRLEGSLLAQPVPEPSACASLALVAVVALRRRKRA